MAATSIIDNGPFDPRITSIPFTQNLSGTEGVPGSGGKKLTRGFIIQAKAINGARQRCNFLYNPSAISISHGIDTNVLSDPNAIDKNDVTAGQTLLPLQQTLSFSLLFDRTYELWDPSKLYGDAATKVPALGVAFDVLSLYKITGIATPMPVTDDSSADADAFKNAFNKNTFANGPAGPMTYQPVYVVIGTSLSYYGVIQSLGVTYTHWTQAMIPTRCRVDVEVTLLPTPTGSNGSKPDAIGPQDGNWRGPFDQKGAKSGKGGR
jgi:hypothetical protein